MTQEMTLSNGLTIAAYLYPTKDKISYMTCFNWSEKSIDFGICQPDIYESFLQRHIVAVFRIKWKN